MTADREFRSPDGRTRVTVVEQEEGATEAHIRIDDLVEADQDMLTFVWDPTERTWRGVAMWGPSNVDGCIFDMDENLSNQLSTLFNGLRETNARMDADEASST